MAQECGNTLLKKSGKTRLSIPLRSAKPRRPPSTLAISLKKQLHIHPGQLLTIKVGISEKRRPGFFMRMRRSHS
jgi:hypothetical protein